MFNYFNKTRDQLASEREQRRLDYEAWRAERTRLKNLLATHQSNARQYARESNEVNDKLRAEIKALKERPAAPRSLLEYRAMFLHKALSDGLKALNYRVPLKREELVSVYIKAVQLHAGKIGSNDPRELHFPLLTDIPVSTLADPLYRPAKGVRLCVNIDLMHLGYVNDQINAHAQNAHDENEVLADFAAKLIEKFVHYHIAEVHKGIIATNSL